MANDANTPGTAAYLRKTKALLKQQSSGKISQAGVAALQGRDTSQVTASGNTILSDRDRKTSALLGRQSSGTLSAAGQQALDRKSPYSLSRFTPSGGDSSSGQARVVRNQKVVSTAIAANSNRTEVENRIDTATNNSNYTNEETGEINYAQQAADLKAALEFLRKKGEENTDSAGAAAQQENDEEIRSLRLDVPQEDETPDRVSLREEYNELFGDKEQATREAKEDALTAQIAAERQRLDDEYKLKEQEIARQKGQFTVSQRGFGIISNRGLATAVENGGGAALKRLKDAGDLKVDELIARKDELLAQLDEDNAKDAEEWIDKILEDFKDERKFQFDVMKDARDFKRLQGLDQFEKDKFAVVQDLQERKFQSDNYFSDLAATARAVGIADDFAFKMADKYGSEISSGFVEERFLARGMVVPQEFYTAKTIQEKERILSSVTTIAKMGGAFLPQFKAFYDLETANKLDALSEGLIQAEIEDAALEDARELELYTAKKGVDASYRSSGSGVTIADWSPVLANALKSGLTLEEFADAYGTDVPVKERMTLYSAYDSMLQRKSVWEGDVVQDSRYNPDGTFKEEYFGDSTGGSTPSTGNVTFGSR